MKDFPAISENALRVLRSRYLLRNRSGETVETPDGLFRRVVNDRAVSLPLLQGEACRVCVR